MYQGLNSGISQQQVKIGADIALPTRQKQWDALEELRKLWMRQSKLLPADEKDRHFAQQMAENILLLIRA